LLSVSHNNKRELVLLNDVHEGYERQGMLKTVYEDGDLVRETTLGKIRNKIYEQI